MGRQTGCAGVTSAIGAGPVRDEMLRLSRWIYFLAVSLAVCVLEIIAFLKYDLSHWTAGSAGWRCSGFCLLSLSLSRSILACWRPRAVHEADLVGSSSN